MLTRDRDNARFWLSGLDAQPNDAAWSVAVPSERRAYWRQLAFDAEAQKRRELLNGVDVDGQPLMPRRHPRDDRATGRVLVP